MTLPQGWTETNVGDAAELIRGVTYKKQDARQFAKNSICQF